MPLSMVQNLISYLHQNKIKVPGVIGPSLAAETFSELYCQTFGTTSKMAMDQKIYRLDQVVNPRAVDGKMIVADKKLVNLASDWLLKFIEESIPHEPATLEEATKIIVSKVENNAYCYFVHGYYAEKSKLVFKVRFFFFKQ